MINKVTEERIKSAAKIQDILKRHGVALRQKGHDLIGLCPFHDDRSTGNFIVSPTKNICSCFACGATGMDPIETVKRLYFDKLSDKEAYTKALRYIAAIYGIEVDGQEPPKVEKKLPIRPPVQKLDTVMWTADLCLPFRKFNDNSPLLQYLRSLPLKSENMRLLEKAIINYAVGTYPSNEYEGWSIWWYIDHQGYVRSGKLMKYKQDGHRDKTRSSTWAHSLMARWKTDRNGNEYEAKNWKYDNHTHAPDLRCLFGQHLMDVAPDAVIRIVESEKTALICSAFNDPKEVIWMASGGIQLMTEDKLLTILRKGRRIELFPDYDGYKEWKKKIDREALKPYVHSGMLSISNLVKDLWIEADGPKADIADIMIRIVQAGTETDEQKTVRELSDRYPAVGELIDTMKLELEKIETQI